MKDLSLHNLDIVLNSVHAGADLIEIEIDEKNRGALKLRIKDNGSGIEKDLLEKVKDPFYTTGNKRFGLGIPLLEQKAKQCEGSLKVISEPGKGTEIIADFRSDHIDMPPAGNIAKTLKMLICAYPEKHFIYVHKFGEKKFLLDTDEIAEVFGDEKLNKPGILKLIEEMIIENLKDIGAAWIAHKNNSE